MAITIFFPQILECLSRPQDMRKLEIYNHRKYHTNEAIDA